MGVQTEFLKSCAEGANFPPNTTFCAVARTPPSSIAVFPGLLIIVYPHFSASTASEKQTSVTLSSHMACNTFSNQRLTCHHVCLAGVHNHILGQAAVTPHHSMTELPSVVLAIVLSCFFVGCCDTTPQRNPLIAIVRLGLLDFYAAAST